MAKKTYSKTSDAVSRLFGNNIPEKDSVESTDISISQQSESKTEELSKEGIILSKHPVIFTSEIPSKNTSKFDSKTPSENPNNKQARVYNIIRATESRTKKIGLQVHPTLYQKFKMAATKNGVKLIDAFENAMQNYIDMTEDGI